MEQPVRMVLVLDGLQHRQDPLILRLLQELQEHQELQVLQEHQELQVAMCSKIKY